jgi:hypothetical protein
VKRYEIKARKIVVSRVMTTAAEKFVKKELKENYSHRTIPINPSRSTLILIHCRQESKKILVNFFSGEVAIES